MQSRHHQMNIDKFRSNAAFTRNNASGFTLIEVMIVVAIIGLLTLIAYPSYQEYVARGRRAEMRTVLLEATQWMERHYSENFTYTQNSAGTAIADLFALTNFTKSPRDGGGAYTIAISAVTARTFTITATRGNAMTNDKCGNFFITNTGVKGNLSYSTSSYSSVETAVAACWK
jgi:type IV pilus assembly protein PilE